MRVSLDELDIQLLRLLSKNCRISYEKLSYEIGLTAKSIKSRVKKMQSEGVIDNFAIKVNLRVLDYTRFYFLFLRYSKPSQIKDMVRKLTLVGDIVGDLECVGNVLVILFATKSVSEDKYNLLLDMLRPNIMQEHSIIIPDVSRWLHRYKQKQQLQSQPLSNVDFKVIKSLFSDARMEISNIAQSIPISSKTVARRLQRLTENHTLEFSVLCNMQVMPGFVISIVAVNVEKKFYRDVLEKFHSELVNGSFLLGNPYLGHNDILFCIVCSKDTLTLDRLISRLRALAHINEVNVFIASRIKYHKEVIIKEIERKICETEQRTNGNTGQLFSHQI